MKKTKRNSTSDNEREKGRALLLISGTQAEQEKQELFLRLNR